jgi:hypothetical protein
VERIFTFPFDIKMKNSFPKIIIFKILLISYLYLLNSFTLFVFCSDDDVAIVVVTDALIVMCFNRALKLIWESHIRDHSMSFCLKYIFLFDNKTNL